MKLNKSTAVMDYKLVTSFESLRKRLLEPKFADRLDKPLAYWVISSDRRLPLAFMGRSLRELLDTPFDELFATAGIGQKKIRTFLMLLNRAAQPKPIGALAADEEDIPDVAATAAGDQPNAIDPSIVSEALWVRWRSSVRNYGIQDEPLGRFASSLVEVPRVIWHRPLGTYTELTLAEIRSLKTHGEKRVNAILEVFGNLHKILVNLDAESPLAVRIVPRFLVPIESWVLRWLTSVGVSTRQEIHESLVSPLLEQLKIDAGPLIARLAAGRIETSSGSVRKAANKLGLTRARIYQLLSEVADVVTLRWPAGPALVRQLRDKMQAAGADSELLAWLDTVIELFFERAGSDEERDEAAETSAPKQSAVARGHSARNGTHPGASQRNGHGPVSKTGLRRQSG
jgi:hypothetical protein